MSNAPTVISTRPVLRLDNQENERARELLIALEMVEEEGGMSTVELTFEYVASVDSGGAEFAFEDHLQLGTAIAVYTGDETSPTAIFEGWITGIEAVFPEVGSPEMHVWAEDALYRARMARRTRVIESATVAGIARDVATAVGLTPQVDGLSDDIGIQVQLDESDLVFLRRVALEADAEVQVVGKELHVSRRADLSRGELTLEMHDKLRSARAWVDIAHQVTAVTLSGWDAVQGSRFAVSSSPRAWGAGSGRKGGEELERAFERRSEHIAHLTVATSAEAQAIVDAAHVRRSRRFVQVAGVAEGDARLRVGTRVSLLGLGRRFDNVFTIVRAVHRFDLQAGYLVDFDAECAFLGVT